MGLWGVYVVCVRWDVCVVCGDLGYVVWSVCVVYMGRHVGCVGWVWGCVCVGGMCGVVCVCGMCVMSGDLGCVVYMGDM